MSIRIHVNCLKTITATTTTRCSIGHVDSVTNIDIENEISEWSLNCGLVCCVHIHIKH